ncbi:MULTISPECIES: alkaline phosphatase D family protein [unclassified Pseudoalteromonas]|uniref:alkaline phosphatase D family protein n=1 Tax=unclassified Pseudoalteromonas TaxID=194690 RepID=UPI0011088916|nr:MULTISPECIES: alkaline phosphatase D family protein [unclassified Pseudoalteromonas]TMN81320.1 metallophosphatase [Pseudoalteromonas sp. S410]TMN89301.1 metallophosphatase [Pseudoalteromonas sp. S408]TMN95079.1 metallophosphatase [Pseudoalteromonas sp. S407]TMN96546.1 metallophosphatase [Pseudoalteromonas sp. S409]TMO07734.1 metallophosphatase [Pseudoalteromonas sp. S186]
MSTHAAQLPILLMGPMVRRAEQTGVCIVFATSKPAQCQINILNTQSVSEQQTIALGERLFLQYVVIKPTNAPFVLDTLLAYQLLIDGKEIDLSAWAYNNQSTPAFVIPDTLNSILHGSCRNAHHPAKDSLVTASQWQNTQRSQNTPGAQLLLLSGDQVYADDVAGPMLLVIHQLIEKLGIYKEQPMALPLPEQLNEQLYNRHHFLPKTPWQKRSKLGVGYWLKKDEPHFSSVKAFNHLIHFEEYVALYLLNLSAAAWHCVDLQNAQYTGQNQEHQRIFNAEKSALLGYSKGLDEVEKLFANVSTLMIFDDHDVTDDWNLTAGWEQAINQNPSSKRIVNNGLISYWLFQGMGNDALAKTGALITPFKQSLSANNVWQFKAFDKPLNEFNHWHYELTTIPKVVVLDTRTHRWRNESNFNEPSGLLDWERLTELEESLLSHDKVIIVSPAPVFGVKSIEAIQAAFNICGQPLMVDVENWMAHEGSAKKLLDTFRRTDTPNETLILSGDVHYSFCFSVQKRFGDHPNRIWQLTASGIKNEFPRKLINVLDKLDSILYGPKSPLNFFTKRWHMEVDKHQTVGEGQKYLVSDSAISLITLQQGDLSQYQLIHGDGHTTEFDLEHK